MGSWSCILCGAHFVLPPIPIASLTHSTQKVIIILVTKEDDDDDKKSLWKNVWNGVNVVDGYII